MKRLIPLFAIPLIALSLLLLANCKSNETAVPEVEAEVTTETVSETATTAESEAETKASLEVKVETKPEAAAKIICNPVFQPEASKPVDLEPVGHAVRFVGLCMVMTSIIVALIISASLSWTLLQKRKGAHDIQP